MNGMLSKTAVIIQNTCQQKCVLYCERTILYKDNFINCHIVASY